MITIYMIIINYKLLLLYRLWLGNFFLQRMTRRKRKKRSCRERSVNIRRVSRELISIDSVDFSFFHCSHFSIDLRFCSPFVRFLANYLNGHSTINHGIHHTRFKKIRQNSYRFPIDPLSYRFQIFFAIR